MHAATWLSGQDRYWDGSAWQDQFRDAASTAAGKVNLALIEQRLRNRKSLTTTERATDLLATAEGSPEVDGARLRGDSIEHKGKRYSVDKSVTARLDSSGGQAVAQGLVMKTTHDSRQEFVIVDGDGFYLELKVWTGATVGTDLSAQVNNFNYRQATGQARKFVAAVNNAAKTWTPERAAATTTRATGRREQLAARRAEAFRDRNVLNAIECSGFGSHARRVRKLRRQISRDIKRIEKAMTSV